MINSLEYKIIAGKIAKLFCNDEPICSASVKERIINNFTDATFAIFLQNIQYGRFYILKYSNWRPSNNCRHMLIDVHLTDAITGEIKKGFWEYDNRNCGNEQYYFPDLNTLISRMGYQLVDPPIRDKSTPEITKPRLIYNRNAKSYDITYIPPVPGGGGGGNIVRTPPAAPPAVPPAQLPVEPAASGFDIKSLLENPMVLIGVGLIAVYFLMKK